MACLAFRRLRVAIRLTSAWEDDEEEAMRMKDDGLYQVGVEGSEEGP